MAKVIHGAASSVHDEFCDYVLELLEPLGRLRARRMFGGYALYYGQAAFAIVFDDTLYLKADGRNRAAFEAEGCAPFTYTARGREIALGYFAPPEHALEDSEELCAWARGAVDAALRQQAAGRERRKRAARTAPRPRRKRAEAGRRR